MGVISKSTIETCIVPYLTVGSRGFSCQVPLSELVEAIFFRLKTGCQWRELPIKEFFGTKSISWNTVFYHFNKWSKDGCWRNVWVNLLKYKSSYLDLSSMELDGSHTPAKNGGQAVGYQGRKACKTTNALFISDNQGVMLAMASPQEGQHHDLFEIEPLFKEMCQLLEEAEIATKGLFLNADPGFDSKEFHAICESMDIFPNIKPNPRNSKDIEPEPYQNGTPIFDEELYKDRSVIEHANAWIDGFKALLVRFETTARNWKSLHFMAFFVIFIRKIEKQKKV